MKNKIVTLTACAIALAASGAIAQDTDIKDKEYKDHGQKVEHHYKDKVQQQAQQQLDIKGIDVYTLTVEKVGDVDKIVKSKQEKMAVIGMEGSLKEVAVPLNELQVRPDRITVSATKEGLKSKQDTDMSDFEELKPGEYTRSEFSRFEEKIDTKTHQGTDSLDQRSDRNMKTARSTIKQMNMDDEASEKEDY